MPTLQAPFRLAILECDDPIDSVRRKLGGHTGAFKAVFAQAADSLADPISSFAREIEISSWDVLYKHEYPSLDSIDAVLVSGSRFCAYHEDPWVLKLVDFVKSVLARPNIRLIGVCFGHQAIARCLGAQVGQNPLGWEVSVSEISLTERGRKLFGKDSLSLHLFNRDRVAAYPPGVEALGHTPKNDVHGMYVAGKLLTVQGHPEFTEAISREILQIRKTSGILDTATFEEAFPRSGKASDGVYVAKAFLKFLFESKQKDHSS